MNLVTIKRALLSVSDKSGIVEFARALQRFGIEIISTGGTLSTLQQAGIVAQSISEITGYPEIFDGRVKTLHPKIHGGLLAVPENPKHRQQMDEFEIASIDLVAVNLYPFEEKITRNGISLDEAIEEIDIGGPTMLRAAAKNFKYKTVIVNPANYNIVLEELTRNHGAISAPTRFSLATEVFHHTAHYDAVIAGFLGNTERGTTPLPSVLSIALPKTSELRYGENPHQLGALYGSFHTYFSKLHGKELSYNNIVDIQAAAELVEEFDDPTVVIIKHTNPCGVGSAPTIAAAYQNALATDPKSAFGGIVAMNRTLDLNGATAIDKIFTEVIIAPDYAPGVAELLQKKKDRRLIRQQKPLRKSQQMVIRTVAGGALVQSADDNTEGEWKVVTRRSPSAEEQTSMKFASRVAKHVKSNAIVYAREDRTIGIGAGQMSRFDSSRLAVMKANDAGLDLRGTVVASDAFFPFADGLLEAVKAGATAVIQPGGSVRDAEVIEAADAAGIAMVVTGIRHFKH